MKTYGAFEAKTHLSRLLDEVEKGEEILILKRGRPVARLVPVHKTIDRSELVERIKASREGITLDGLSWKALRDEGRR